MLERYGVMLGTKLGFKCWRVEIGCCGKVLLVVSNVWVAFHCWGALGAYVDVAALDVGVATSVVGVVL